MDLNMYSFSTMQWASWLPSYSCTKLKKSWLLFTSIHLKLKLYV